MHINMSQKTATLVKSGYILEKILIKKKTKTIFFREIVLWFSLRCPTTALPQLCEAGQS